MSSQSTEERKAKENLVVFPNGSTYDIKFDGSIRGGMCQATHPIITYYYLVRLLGESKDYYKPIKPVISFNDNYIGYKRKDKNKNLSPKEYLDMIKPYLSDIINDHKEWKIQLAMRINFISSKDLKETGTMHTRSDNIKIMMSSETNDIIEELFESLQKYQKR